MGVIGGLGIAKVTIRGTPWLPLRQKVIRMIKRMPGLYSGHKRDVFW